MPQCVVCGVSVPEGAKVCPDCGTVVQSPPGPTPEIVPPAPPASPSGSLARLTLKRQGTVTSETFPLGGRVVVGRFDADSGPVDVDLGRLPEGDYISRSHAELGPDATGQWFIKDLNSRSGTFLRRAQQLQFQRVTGAQALHDGDEIALGNVRFEFFRGMKVTESSPPPQRTASATTQFGIALFQQLADGAAPQNIFISPLSIHTCLQMVYNGASGTTADEIAQVLHLAGTTVSESNTDCARFLSDLQTPPPYMRSLQGGDKSGSPMLRLEIANAVWGNRQVTFQPHFMQTCQSAFAAELSVLDFRSPAAVFRINAWVNEKTHGKIPTIINHIHPDDLMVLVNSAYFKGRWEHEFDKSRTKPGAFHLASGQVTQVPMMPLHAPLEYCEDNNIQAVRLAYTDRRFSMYVFLPKPSVTLPRVCAMLSTEGWAQRFSERPGELQLPRFTMRYESRLSAPLANLGMRLAFSRSADFSGMVTPPPMPWVGEVLHKTFVDVNEEGTEAAAITAMLMTTAAMAPPVQPFKMIVDRPFLVAVVHEATSAMLFLGTVANPA